MNNRKYHTNPDELLAQGQAIMSSSDEARYLFRVFAVNMVLAGTPASQVGASAGFTKAAVTGWVKTVDEQGFEALRPQKRAGRPSKLTAEQLADIDSVLQDAGTGRLCLLILRQSTISKSASGSASGCSIGLAIPASAHSPSRAKAMKIRKSGKLLKKTRRNRKRRIPYPDLSGRSPFSDSDYGDISLVQKGKCAYCKIFSGAFQGVLQRLRYSGKRGIIHRKASNLQL